MTGIPGDKSPMAPLSLLLIFLFALSLFLRNAHPTAAHQHLRFSHARPLASSNSFTNDAGPDVSLGPFKDFTEVLTLLYNNF